MPLLPRSSVLWLGLALSVPSTVDAEVVVGRVVDVRNAGYFGVVSERDGRPFLLYVRLRDVACPSTDQDRDNRKQEASDKRHGEAANRFVQALIGGKTVTVEFDRLEPDKPSCFAHVRLEDGTDVGRELLYAGLGWLRDPAAADPDLIAVQAEARNEGRGIWGERRYKAQRPMWQKVLLAIGLLVLVPVVLILIPLLGELLLLAVVGSITGIAYLLRGKGGSKPQAVVDAAAASGPAKRTVDPEIERLKTTALAQASAYAENRSLDDIRSGLAHYQSAEKHYVEEVLGGDGPAAALDAVRDELVRAVETAPGNGWLFERCLRLVGQVHGGVKDRVPDWAQECQDALAERWPEMVASYEKCRAAERGGMVGLADHIGRQSGGRLPTLPQQHVNAAGRSARQEALAAVQSCLVNPEAWFQLSYQFFAAGDEAYSEELDTVVDALKDAHGAALAMADGSDKEA
jgi:endonuclease YncB( thermonuclease family)